MNSRERKAFEKSGLLPPMSGSQIAYARDHSDRYAFSYYRKTYCSECGSPVVDGRCPAAATCTETKCVAKGGTDSTTE